MLDFRYQLIKDKLTRREIKFSDILNEIPAKTLAKHINKSERQIKKILQDISLCKFEFVFKIADLIGMDRIELVLIVGEEIPHNRFK